MTSSIIDKNLEIIAQRWPDLIQQIEDNLREMNVERQEMTIVANQIQLTSNYAPEQEALMQISNVNSSSDNCYVYGCALGEVQRALLAKQHIRQVNVVILNFTLFYYSIFLYDQSDWLGNEQIQISSYLSIDSVVKPFVAIPSELILADDKASKLRDIIDIEFANEYFEKKHQNDGRNESRFIENSRHISLDKDILSYDRGSKKRAVIAAAGPSLSQSYTQLAEVDKDNVLIVALDASVSGLLDNGIVPDVIFSVDPDAFFLLDGIDFSLLEDVSLVYFPRVNPKLLEQWLGDKFVSYSHGEIYRELDKKYPRTKLYSAGSVIHPAVDFVRHIGIKDVVLLGADFSFPGGKSHANWNFWQEQIANPLHWVKNYRGEKVTTTPAFKLYLRGLEDFIIANPQMTFYYTSEDSAKLESTIKEEGWS